MYSLLQKPVVDILGSVLVDDGASAPTGRNETVELEIIEARPLLLPPLGQPVAAVPIAAGH